MKKAVCILLFLGPGFSLSAQVNLLNNLQACYPLDCPNNGIATNGAPTGAALNGTILGNVTCITGHLGAPNTALQFGGATNDFIRLVNNPLIKPTTSLTISGWFYVTALNSQDLVFMKNTCNSNFNAISFIAENSTFQIYKRPGSPGACGSGTNAASVVFPLNTWHHVVCYADNFFLKIIVNNTSPVVTSHTIAFDYDSSTEVILGGTDQVILSNNFSGRMDNLRFWNRELTGAEITFLFNNDPSCSTATPPPTSISKDEDLNDNLSFYPNPSNGKIFIANVGKKALEIYDVTGKSVSYFLSPVNAKITEVHIKDQSEGFYFYRFIDANGNHIKTGKLVIIK